MSKNSRKPSRSQLIFIGVGVLAVIVAASMFLGRNAPEENITAPKAVVTVGMDDLVVENRILTEEEVVSLPTVGELGLLLLPQALGVEAGDTFDQYRDSLYVTGYANATTVIYEREFFSQCDREDCTAVVGSVTEIPTPPLVIPDRSANQGSGAWFETEISNTVFGVNTVSKSRWYLFRESGTSEISIENEQQRFAESDGADEGGSEGVAQESGVDDGDDFRAPGLIYD